MASGGRISTRIKSRSSLASQGGKLKTLKLSFKTGNLTGERGEGTSFLGDYDRELDEHPEEPLAFEEQFILRVPKEVAEGTGGKHGEGLRDLIKNRKIDNGDVSFKFLGTLRFSLGSCWLTCE
jgi:transcription initiation factor TFIID subunit 7